MAPTGWLDIHGHFLPPQTAEEALARQNAYHALLFMVPDPPTWSAELVLSYLDRANVSLQMLSNIPPSLDALRASNTHGLHLVAQHPCRFGLLAALPTDNPSACLAEIDRTTTTSVEFPVAADGFAVTTVYNGVSLSDERLEPVWTKLNSRGAVVHMHPNAYAPPTQGRPSPVIEVAFDTARTAVDMLYKGVFRRYPDIRFVLAHSGGALPVLSGRLALLGTEAWVPNAEGITREEIETQLGALWVDTAATAKTGLVPAMRMVGAGKCVYGADCGVPCSTELTMEENRLHVLEMEEKETGKRGGVGMNGWTLFPAAARRAEKSG
ncbi:MAG: hypothetical protein M1819_006565 [Sarea resinae]|nr:MAG: hypothetical protein M1819_006565 [Sarea resinae]